MNILKTIENLAQEIKSNPKSIDLSNVYSILVQAREVVLDGLNRSKDANKLKPLEQELMIHKKNVAEATTKITELTEANVRLEADLQNFEGLYSHLKEVTNGRAILALQESPEILNTLVEKISNPTSINAFIETKREVDKLFNESYTPTAQPKELNLKGDKYINPKYFRIGGN
jgi:DNA repair exonuclease SbcCD ATPase subunit